MEQRETVVDVTGEHSPGHVAADARDGEALAREDGIGPISAVPGDGVPMEAGPAGAEPGGGVPMEAESAGDLAANNAAGADEDEAGGNGSRDSGDEPAPERSLAALEQESEIAADYIEGLLDVADLDGDIDMDVEADRPMVSVVGATLEELVGPHGEVLEALQELTRIAVHRQTGTRSRIMLDVGGYRVRRREELAELGRSTADEVARTGTPRRLAAMTPFERKIVHDAVAAAGLRSESEGEEPERRVVVFPVG